MSQAVSLSLEYALKQDDIKKIAREFAKPLFRNKFFINKDGLIRNSQNVDFTEGSWTRNPMKFCLDHYDQQDFFKIILLVNNIPSFFAFKQENLESGVIKAPRQSDIIEVLNFKTV